MPRPRVVLPSTERVDLSDGDWLELKRELAYGESLELSNASRLEGGTIDLKDYYLLRAALYIVDWSFVDDKGAHIDWDDGKDDERTALQVLERRKQFIASLDTATGGEIQQAINQLEGRLQAERAPKIEGTTNETEQTATVAPPPKIAVARSST